MTVGSAKGEQLKEKLTFVDNKPIGQIVKIRRIVLERVLGQRALVQRENFRLFSLIFVFRYAFLEQQAVR